MSHEQAKPLPSEWIPLRYSPSGDGFHVEQEHPADPRGGGRPLGLRVVFNGNLLYIHSLGSGRLFIEVRYNARVAGWALAAAIHALADERAVHEAALRALFDAKIRGND